MSSLGVIVADGDRSFCAAAEAALADREHVKVVGCAHGSEEALDLVKKLSPDLVLLGSALWGVEGIDVVRQMRRLCPQTAVVVVGEVDDEARTDRDVSAFVSGDASVFANLDAVLALASFSAALSAGEPPTV